MDLPPSSEAEESSSDSHGPSISFLSPDGSPLSTPREWMPAVICVNAPIDAWEQIQLDRHDMPLPLTLRRIHGQPRIVADWPRSGVGNYQIKLTWDTYHEPKTITIRSEKLSPSATNRLLIDLETELPASIALALQRLGAFAGLHLSSAGETTLAQEFTRLQRAIGGVAGRPGLGVLLPQIARDPHQRLQSLDSWTHWERARRPHPARLHQAIATGPLLAVDRPPERVLDTRVEHTANVYENQLLKTYYEQVDRRLRRLYRAHGAPYSLQAATHALLSQLNAARRQATFLTSVLSPPYLPTGLTMVLQRRPDYRAVLEGYLELHRSPTVRLDIASMDAPMENLPSLYQTWGTLQVVTALLAAAIEAGFTLVTQRLVGRDKDGIFAHLLPDGKAVLILKHPTAGTTVSLIPERTYSKNGLLHSVSFAQRPDIAIEILAPNLPSSLILFDPKYKLDSEGQDGVSSPLKVDIDKMHTYRDAIRDDQDRHVVQSAHILYPGASVFYGEGIGALGGDPQDVTPLQKDLRHLLSTIAP